MTETRHYDAAIIGTGQGGKPLATALARAGHRTVIIERDHVGGSCVNEGCTPTKTMVASARVAYLARRTPDYGIDTGPVSVDMGVVRQRKRDIVDRFRNGGQRRLENTENLDLLMGDTRFAGPKELEVNLKGKGKLRLTADRIFINTGTHPSVPPVEGLESVPFLDNRSIMELDEVPDHLLVLGGGYVGLEFGQMFRRFGSEVTIVQRSGQLLPRKDEDVADELTNILREDGVEVLLKTQALRADSEDGAVELEVRTPDGKRVLSGSHLLVATGRTPNTERLNLRAAGVKTKERSFILVDDRLETSVPGVYALGDVAAAFGKELFAGAAGTVAMTASSTLEMKLRDRGASAAPAQAAAKVLKVEPADEESEARFRRLTEVAYPGYVHDTLAALKRMLPRDKGSL